MCKIKEPYLKSKTFTGYKQVIVLEGKYYSPVTGIEYEVGKKVTPVTLENFENIILSIPNLERKMDETSWIYPHIVLNPKTQFYNEYMYGMTGVYAHKDDAFKDTKGVIVVKMTISDNLHHAELDHSIDIVVGNFIESIETLDG
jgi:hypothetical protein